ncbi:MAG TPA: GH3 auxin-responsive promoter family protein [Phycisphaerae bacterium]|nr:GH3 auxin-responsive promoter family protein [Phycisphaerae bacterium]
MRTPLDIRLQRLAWAPLRFQAKRQVRRWLERVRRTPEVQARLLARLLEQAAETAFGRDFQLAGARTIQDLRAAMPIAGYERAEPYVQRVACGETEALFPRGTRVHMFALTSGTTGTPKMIPVTDALLRDYRTGWQVWGVHALEDHYDAFGARILQIASRMDEQATPAGIPAGAMSGLMAHAQHPAVRWLYVSPPEACYADDTASKYYLACRLGLRHRRVMPITANPSTLLGLARAMDERKEDLLRDLADGTLANDVALDGARRRRIARRLKACPARARALEAVVRRTGRLYPKDAWKVPLIGTWKGGTLSLYLREMAEYWGDAPARDIGLIASEGRFSVPLRTEGSEGILEVAGTFYEFVPEAQADAPAPDALLAHETEIGQRYFLVLTTASGLFRYWIGDLVEVVDRVGPAPVIRFLNRGEHVSNLTGEKITEFQVTSAANQALGRLGLAVRNYCLCPTWDAVPYYSLLVEESEVDAPRAGRLASEVDAALAALNMEYEGKRRSGRLGPVRVKTIPQGAWRAYDAQAIARRKARVEQYKHKFLSNDMDFDQRFAVCACYGPPQKRKTDGCGSA